MNWIVVSLLSAFAFAIVSILDKVLLVRYITNARTFIVMVGIIQFPMGLIVLPFYPMQSYPLWAWTAAYLSGFLWGLSLVAMFWAMSKEDVSRVIPVISISPVFVAILAVVFLGENLTIFHWIAIFITVAGAALISIRMSGSASGFSLSPSFFLLILGAAAFGSGQFLSKFAFEEMSLWNLFTIRNIGLGSACILLMIRRESFAGMWQAVTNLETFSVFFVTEGILVFVALFFTLWAIDLGPVSLVATVVSTRPLFVFVLSVVLSLPLWKLLDEPLDRSTLTNKVVSTVMIVVGISAISLL